MSATNTTITRNLKDLESPTGNVYEAVAVIAKRSNQIATKIKEELNTKLEEFATPADSLEEVYENREQIEISRQYERMPKPTLQAIDEFKQGKIYYRNDAKTKAGQYALTFLRYAGRQENPDWHQRKYRCLQDLFAGPRFGP